MNRDKNDYEFITIRNFPKATYIELPDKYRKTILEMIHLKFHTTSSIKRALELESLTENFFRWKSGYDKGFPQSINLGSILFLLQEVQKTKESIKSKVHRIKSSVDFSAKKIEKSQDIISLTKDLQLIYGGCRKLSSATGISPNSLRFYTSDNKAKALPTSFVKSIVSKVEDEILCFDFTDEELQNNILSYRASHGKKIVPNFEGKRNLPIHITPEFESIIFHLFGDGYVKAVGSGEYTQLNSENRKNFVHKLYNCFGYFDTAKDSYAEGRVVIPKIIIEILCKKYALSYSDFRWNLSKLPNKLHDDNSFKIAGLSAFIVDEGHVSHRGIEIYSGNRQLLSQIRTLALDLELNCSAISSKNATKNTKESYRFRIRKKSSVRLSEMIRLLEKEFLYCGLGCKKNKLFKSGSNT